MGDHLPLASSPHIEPEIILQQLTQVVEDAVGHEEDIDELEDTLVRVAMGGPSLGTDLRKRTGTARKQLLQHVAYTALMEQRMRNMEKRLRELEKKAGDQDMSSDEEPDSEGTKKRKRNYVAILGISRMSFDEYKPKPQELETYNASSYGEQHNGDIPMAKPPQRRLIEVVVNSLGAGNGFQRRYYR